MAAARELHMPTLGESVLDMPIEWMRALSIAREVENDEQNLPPGTTRYTIEPGWP